MRFPWASRTRKSVSDATAVGGTDSLSMDGATASEASISPMVSAHVQLHTRPLSTLSRRHSASSAATPNDNASVAVTPETMNESDPSGKDKPVPVPIKEVVTVYLRHNWISIIYSTVALALVVLLVYLSFFAAVMDDDNGTKPEFLSCRSWAFGDDCGLWGINCRPFDTEWSAIRCRSRCTLDQSSSLSVWGTDKYHANSRICRAAVHAGVVGTNGGCALMRYAGPANAFVGSSAHGVTTQSYASWFPKTFEFRAAPSRYCTDLTWPILVVSVLLSAGFALLPRTNAGMLFAMLVGSGFFYVRLVGQPQSVDYAGIAIGSFSDVLVLLAASSWLYAVAPAHTFGQWSTLTLRERVVFWSVCYVVPYYVLLNMNMFEYVPWLNINLGGYQDTPTNAGTYVVVALLVLVMLYCAYRFLRALYRQNLWRRLALWYGVVASAVLLSWLLFTSTDFHLHHTMLGALFLPLTRFPTPLAAMAQSALLGCFVQGYAAWGWDSYLNTVPTYLTIEKPKAAEIANITMTGANFSWAPVDGVDGYSLRLNKVEVYRGTATNALVDGLQPNVTYFVTVAGVAAWGTDSQDGPKANFTTLAEPIYWTDDDGSVAR